MGTYTFVAFGEARLWFWSVPITAVAVSTTKCGFLAYFKNAREVKTWIICTWCLFAGASLSSIIALLLLELYVDYDKRLGLVAGFLALDILQFTASICWALRFWCAPLLIVYAPVCKASVKHEHEHEQSVSINASPLAQLYGVISDSEQPITVNSLGVDTEGIVGNSEEVSDQVQFLISPSRTAM
jgi:hypothetical protein